MKTFAYRASNAPKRFQVMASMLDVFYKNSIINDTPENRKAFLEIRLENIKTCYPYWVHRCEKETIEYLLNEEIDKQKLRDLYKLFESID